MAFILSSLKPSPSRGLTSPTRATSLTPSGLTGASPLLE